MNRINIYVGEDNKLHFINSGGADSVLPFNKISASSFTQIQCTTMNSSSSYTINLSGYDGYIVIVHATAGTYPTASGCDCVNIGNINSGASNGSSGTIYFCPSGGALSISSVYAHRGYTVIGISS